MSWQGLALVVIPITSLMLTVFAHLVIAYRWPDRLPWWSLSLASAASIFYAAASTAYLLSGGPASELLSYSFVNVAGALAFAFCYFCFVTLNYTSLRVRMLRELASSPEGLPIEDLKSRYSSEIVLDLRLARLIKAGELRRDGMFYFPGASRRFIMIGRAFQLFQTILGIRSRKAQAGTARDTIANLVQPSDESTLQHTSIDGHIRNDQNVPSRLVSTKSLPIKGPAPLVAAASLFVFVFWYLSDGVPYFRDANESFLMYVHAWALANFDPSSYSFLSALDLTPAGPGFIYMNNPNLPRWAHYILLQLGVGDFGFQLLIITAVAAAAAFFFLHRFFGPTSSFLVALALLCDFAGSQYLTNSFRVFSFTLFFACLWSMKSGRWIPLTFFALWQLEFGFALFVSVTCGVMFYNYYRRWLAAAVSSAVSVALFASQVTSYVGVAGLSATVHDAASRRVFMEQTGFPAVPWLLHTLKVYFTTFGSVFILTGLILAFLSVIYAVASRPGGDKELLSRLFLSMCCGGAVILVVLPGYVGDAYFLSGLPFLTLFVGVGFALVTLNLSSVTGLPATLSAVLLALVLVSNSVRLYRAFPPLGGEYVEALRNAGITRVSIDKVFQGAAFAGAGVWETYDPSMSDAGYYLCLHRPWSGVDCDQRRHDFPHLVASGRNFFLARSK